METLPDAVVPRAFALLAAFDERHVGLTLSQLARRSGLAVSTTHRLVRALVAQGALERIDGGCYVIGLRLFEIAALAPRGVGVRSIALPFLADLRDLTSQHAMLTVREAEEAVLVERLTARGAVRVRYRVGGRLPLDATGGGLALLAHAPDDVRERMIESFRPRDGFDRLSTPEDLRRMLADIRQSGIVIATQSGGERFETIAAPITVDGEVVAAISVVLPRDDDPARFAPAVAACARAIARQSALALRGRPGLAFAPTAATQ